MSVKDYPAQAGRSGYVVQRAMDETKIDPVTGRPVVDYQRYVVVRDCMFCGKESRITVPGQGLWAWEHGTFAQDAFPDLTPAEREMVMTGTHPECWDAMIPDDDE